MRHKEEVDNFIRECLSVQELYDICELGIEEAMEHLEEDIDLYQKEIKELIDA